MSLKLRKEAIQIWALSGGLRAPEGAYPPLEFIAVGSRASCSQRGSFGAMGKGRRAPTTAKTVATVEEVGEGVGQRRGMSLSNHAKKKSLDELMGVQDLEVVARAAAAMEPMQTRSKKVVVATGMDITLLPSSSCFDLRLCDEGEEMDLGIRRNLRVELEIEDEGMEEEYGGGAEGLCAQRIVCGRRSARKEVVDMEMCPCPPPARKNTAG